MPAIETRGQSDLLFLHRLYATSDLGVDADKRACSGARSRGCKANTTHVNAALAGMAAKFSLLDESLDRIDFPH